jgi:hypothetical protein
LAGDERVFWLDLCVGKSPEDEHWLDLLWHLLEKVKQGKDDDLNALREVASELEDDLGIKPKENSTFLFVGEGEGEEDVPWTVQPVPVLACPVPPALACPGGQARDGAGTSGQAQGHRGTGAPARPPTLDELRRRVEEEAKAQGWPMIRFPGRTRWGAGEDTWRSNLRVAPYGALEQALECLRGEQARI